MVAGSYGGAIWVSINSGASWNSSRLGYWYGAASSADGSVLAVVGEAGILISTNLGVVWTPSTNAPALFWDAVACSSDGTKLIATGGASDGGNLLYRSTDAGTTWSLATNAPNVGWYGLASSSDGTRLVATGGNATYSHWIFTSSDAGNTWISNSAPYVDWTSVASSADGSLLVGAVNNGGIWTWRPTAPTVARQPTNQTAFVGAGVIFNLSVTGTVPLVFGGAFNLKAACHSPSMVFTKPASVLSSPGSGKLIISVPDPKISRGPTSEAQFPLAPTPPGWIKSLSFPAGRHPY